MATREQATLSANEKRMNRNSAEMAKPLEKQRPEKFEMLKRIPRGKAAQETWRPPARSKKARSSGR